MEVQEALYMKPRKSYEIVSYESDLYLFIYFIFPSEHHRGQAGQEAVAVPLGPCAHQHRSDCSEVSRPVHFHFSLFGFYFTYPV